MDIQIAPLEKVVAKDGEVKRLSTLWVGGSVVMDPERCGRFIVKIGLGEMNNNNSGNKSDCEDGWKWPLL